MKMKRHYILYFTILGALCVGMPAFAQDDAMADDEEVAVVRKKPTVKLPTYPTKEVKGICIDAATKKPWQVS